MNRQIIAITGKGGVGKTAFTTLLARVALAEQFTPLLCIDADPAGGLTSAFGITADVSLCAVRDRIIETARHAGAQEKERLADQIDYLVMEALIEEQNYSLLAMGHSKNKKGCFCPANSLLRSALKILVDPFRLVLIDAEAGIEQINRQVTESVSLTIILVDGSLRSMNTLNQIVTMLGSEKVAVVANRTDSIEKKDLPAGCAYLGCIPEDKTLLEMDRQGKAIFHNLSANSPALQEVKKIWRKFNFGIQRGK